MKKTFTLQRKIKTLLLLNLAVILITSCNFSVNKNAQLNEESNLVHFVSVLPEAYVNGRSAIPEFSDSTLLYKVTATSTESTVDTITKNGCHKDFSLPLLPNKNYTVKVDAYDQSDTSQTPLFTGTKENIIVSNIITEENGPFTIQLKLYKDTTGQIKTGNGSISLDFIVTYDDKDHGHFYEYILSGNDISPQTKSKGVSAGVAETISIESIPANINPYDLFIKFKRGSEVVYQFHTDVMVFAETVTNTWKNESELGSGNNANKLVISQAFVDAYTSKYFYVKNDSEISDNGQGTYQTPWRSLQNAIEKITEINDGTSKYTIYILDDLSGSYQVTESSGPVTYHPGQLSCTIPANNTEDIKICIQGITPVLLDSDNASAPEISILNNSNKNVFFELVNLNCEHSIQATNAEVKMTVVSAPVINVTKCSTTLIGVTADEVSVSETISGSGSETIQPVFSESIIQIGGLSNAPNDIELLSLPNNSSGNQIKLKVLNVNSDTTPLTLNNSSIGILTATKPSAGNPLIQFTEDFATASNTTDSASSIFISKETTPYAIGIIGSGTAAGEACLGLSMVTVSPQAAQALTLKFYNSNGNEISNLNELNISSSDTTATEIIVKAFYNDETTSQAVDVSSLVTWNFAAAYHGTTLTSSELSELGISFTEPTSTAPAKITLNSGINSGLYQIYINPNYTSQETTYSNGFSFDVDIL